MNLQYENFEEFKNKRYGYSGKPKQWQYGFDLAWNEQQIVIDKLISENNDLKNKISKQTGD